jgi:NitT/TauT family transport system permease protein
MTVTTPSTQASRTPSRAAGPLVTVAFTIALLLLWQAATVVLAIPSFILPSPTAIAVAGWENRAVLGEATVETASAVAAGFLVGNLGGLLGAIAIASSPAVARTAMPLALGIRSVPIIALAPFLTLYLGRGPVAITTVTALIVFFPTLINGVFGLRSVDPRSMELFHVLHVGWFTTLLRLRLPAALPSIFAALRISAPSAVLGAMIAEWVVSGGGLGYLILSASISARTALMWSAVVVSTLVAGVAFAAVAIAERRAIPWAADATR